MSIFSKRLKELREDCGLNRKELAQAIGYSAANVTRWEQGVRYPNSHALETIARYFDVTTDYLVGNETPVTDSRGDRVKEILDISQVNNMTPDQYEEFKRHVEAVTSAVKKSRKP